MKILNSNTDKEEWLGIWNGWNGKEVFVHPDYINLYTDGKSQAYCAVLQENDATVLYPFIKRPLKEEPYCGNELFDITTAYGYSGIYAFGNWNKELIERFCEEFSGWAKNNNVVCEFVRFALDSPTKDYYAGEAVLNNQNIIVDLTVDKESTWSNFKHKVRKNVNKARANNLKIEFDDDGSKIEEFLNIYYSTMDRRNAGEGYYFSKEYFQTIIEKLKGQFVFAHAFHDGEMISTELVLVSDENIYSFLGGTLNEYFDMRPNDLLKFEIINWGREHGKKRFVLGGGYIPMDGIFQYKLSFAPDGIVPFYIGKRIFMQDKYDELVANKQRTNGSSELNESYFPLYRA